MEFAGMIQMEVIRPVWKQVVKGKSGNSQFLHRNVALFDKDGHITDYSMLALSTGELPLPRNIAVTNHATGNGSLLITWDDNSGVDMAKKSDRLKVVAIKDGLPLVVKGLDAVRSDGMSLLQLPYEAGDEVHLYLYFMDEAGLVASPSVHAPVTIGDGTIELSHEELSHEELSHEATKSQSTQITQNVVYVQSYSSGTDVYWDYNWTMGKEIPPHDCYRGQEDNHHLLLGRGDMVNSSLTSSPMTAILFLASSLRVGMTATYDYPGG
jgi:hypothetical protein